MHAYGIPRGMMVRIIGTVSKVFRPYLSERFPTRGVITNVPSPMICISHKHKQCHLRTNSNNDCVKLPSLPLNSKAVKVFIYQLGQILIFSFNYEKVFTKLIVIEKGRDREIQTITPHFVQCNFKLNDVNFT